MKFFINIAVFILGIIFFNSLQLVAQKPNATEVIDKLILSMDKVKSAKYTLKKTERIKGNLIESKNNVKLQLSPLKIYLYSIKPNPGAELLFVKGENSDNVLVSPNKFPFFSLNLNPYSSLLREDQHHTILDLGFGYMSTVLKSYIKKYGEKFYATVKIDGEVIWNSEHYYKVVIENNSFKFINYTVKKGEDVTDIANRNHISDYMILEHNHEIGDYKDVKPGQTILIPNSYAKKIIFYVDKVHFLPLYQAIYDDKGLYESYEIQNLKYNITIPQNEFTRTFKEYKF